MTNQGALLLASCNLSYLFFTAGEHLPNGIPSQTRSHKRACNDRISELQVYSESLFCPAFSAAAPKMNKSHRLSWLPLEQQQHQVLPYLDLSYRCRLSQAQPVDIGLSCFDLKALFKVFQIVIAQSYCLSPRGKGASFMTLEISSKG